MNTEIMRNFLRESNKIEGITRYNEQEQIAAAEKFLQLESVRMSDLLEFVFVIQPNAQLRNRVGLDVRVGAHIPPPGGPDIRDKLQAVLDIVNMRRGRRDDPSSSAAFENHKTYEDLHPFTDGNGRSGRMLWLWEMVRTGYDGSLGFLHMWYYQSLNNNRKE